MEPHDDIEIRGVLLDIDGVLTVSAKPLDGAVAALSALRTRGLPFRLLTNTTELSRAELLDTLAGAGFDLSPEELITAPVVTAAYLRANHARARCFLIGGHATRGDLDGIEVVEQDGDVVVVGGASEAISWDVMNHALRMVLDGAPLIAMHRSATWMTADGMVMDSGVALVAGLEEATGKKAVVCGKPSPQCFEQALATMKVPAQAAMMVGDDLKSDVLAAQALGITGVLVKTGKFTQAAVDDSDSKPDHVVHSVADLQSLLSV